MLKRINKIVRKLHSEQVYEPVDTLFVLHDKIRNRYTFLGGDGEPLSQGIPKITNESRDFSETEMDYLTPKKHRLPFTSGKDLAERQRE